MPRLGPSLFRRAGSISPHLATLLPVCRTLESAQAELRWIRQHVLDSRPAEPKPPSWRNDAVPLGNSRRRDRTRRRGACCRVKVARSDRNPRSSSSAAEDLVARLVARRGAGEPLQYVLGTQPFGDLEILCEKGVLIPRPETEAWAAALADLVFGSSPQHDRVGRSSEGNGEAIERDGGGLRILDLCSGTGCIGLSLYARGMAWSQGEAMREKNRRTEQDGHHGPLPRVFGFDIEPRAVRLARKNLQHNFRGPRSPRTQDGRTWEEIEKAVTFRRADIFTDAWMAHLDPSPPAPGEEGAARRIDVLVSNPPYISQRGFQVDTGRSVRNYEPKIALVPADASVSASTASATCVPADIFYARLLDIADTLRPRVAAFEVGDMQQALRVAEMAASRSSPRQRLDSGKDRQEGEDGPGESTAPRWNVLEIWRDWPDCRPSDVEEDTALVRGREVPVRGSGHGRVVFLAEGQIMRNRFTNQGFRRNFYTD